jgi:hypothetical protein
MERHNRTSVEAVFRRCTPLVETREAALIERGRQAAHALGIGRPIALEQMRRLPQAPGILVEMGNRRPGPPHDGSEIEEGRGQGLQPRADA